MAESGELLRRATAALSRDVAEAGGVAEQHNANMSGVRQHDGREYVVLASARGLLAVYRVRPTGALKRLRRWPSELTDM